MWKIIFRVDEWIQQGERQALPEIASEFGVGADYLNKLFKKELGRSISDYYQFRRIQLANQQLIQTRKSVTEIAADLGHDECYLVSKVTNLTFKG